MSRADFRGRKSLSCDTIATKVAWYQQGENEVKTEAEVKTSVITAVALAALMNIVITAVAFAALSGPSGPA
jgi:hypothetical protein